MYSFFLLLLCPFVLPIALNEAAKINGKTATEDTPPAKKIRRCQRQQVKREPVAGEKADNDRTEDKQGQLPVVGQRGHLPARVFLGGVRLGDILFFQLLSLPFLKI